MGSSGGQTVPRIFDEGAALAKRSPTIPAPVRNTDLCRDGVESANVPRSILPRLIGLGTCRIKEILSVDLLTERECCVPRAVTIRLRGVQTRPFP